jgi:RNA polymerase sigma-70 factor (TIGR02943 family)
VKTLRTSARDSLQMNPRAVPQPLVCKTADEHTLAPLLNRLLRYARSKIRNEAMAEDAVSETLLAALEAQRDFDSLAYSTAWLFGVLKHKLVDQLRKMHREQPAGDMTDECDGDELSWSGAWSHSHSHSLASDPEQALQQQQFMTLLKRACEALPAAQARAFHMREVLDMDTERICDCLGVNQGHLWVLTHRARQHLRRELLRHGATAP